MPELQWAVDGPPIGLWGTFLGSFDGLMQDRLSIRPDGTGFLYSRSPMRGEETLPILWRHPEAGLLEVAAMYPFDDPLEEPQFETVRYRAAVREADVGGSTPVLENCDDDVFWGLVGPIALVSRTPQ